LLQSEFHVVVTYKIANLILLTQVREICSRHRVQLEQADDLDHLQNQLSSQNLHKTLIICELPTLLEADNGIEEIARVARDKNASILGKFPHVSTEAGSRARAAGIEYVVPNSRFTQKLNSILSGA
jgi:hypothetical protein